MGVFADILANAKTFTPLSRVAQRLAQYRDTVDPVAPTAYAEADEVQTIFQFDENPTEAATYSLTFTLPDGTQVTTANIAFADAATTVQDDVDTALTGVVAGYQAGDVVVADSDDGDAGLNADDLTLSFSGDSVTGLSFGLTTITLNDDGALADPASATDVHGQQDRTVLAALYLLGVISDAAPPEEGGTGGVTATSNLLPVPPWFIREMAQEAAFQEDNKGIYDAIIAILPDNDAPLIPE